MADGKSDAPKRKSPSRPTVRKPRPTRTKAAAVAAENVLPPAPRPPAPAPAPAKPAAAAPPESLAAVMSAQTVESMETLSRNLAEVMTRTNNAFANAFHDQSEARLPVRADPFEVQSALSAAWNQIGAQPDTLRDAHAALWRRYGEIWEGFTRSAVLGLPADDAGAPSRDKRFRDPEWRTNPAFSLMRETYLATADWITGLVQNAEGLDAETKHKAAFFIKQAVDAASPSNFLFSNPAALRETLASRGENLLRGSQFLREDLIRGHGMLAIRQTDSSTFKIGVNVATAPGKVIFRNRLIELIQYAPSTESVLSIPLVIIPPWINKFYILDLQEKNSMIRWLVGQGHTVFVASWVNPDAELATLGFEEYMLEGVLAAVGAAIDASGAPKVNTVGYCIGGTLLGATLAYNAATGDDRIQSATFFAAQTDFVEAGDLKVFTDDAGLRYVQERIEAQGGFLDAQAMSDTFNALRSNDLIWNYVVDNYYLGKEPPPFDLLFWNSDQTRMPKALHLYYLQRMYHENALAEGRISLFNQPIRLQDVKIPVYMQAAKEDHIAPFRSVYRSARLFGGPTQLLLAGSGHIAGVINHPDAKKYQHWTNPALPPTPEEWMSNATEHPGSWWPHWHQWLSTMSGPMIPARTPGGGKLPALCDAPGEYVLHKSA